MNQNIKSVSYKKLLLNTLEVFIKFCDENSINYYIAYGTAIGAVRHHGLIPWDDDIDIWMPRSDYEKFLSEYPKNGNKDYELVTPYNNKYYNLAFSKLCLKASTILESIEYKTTIGVYIDLLPLDGAPSNKFIQKIYIKCSNYLFAMVYEIGKKVSKRRIYNALKKKSIMAIAAILCSPIKYTVRSICLKLLHMICLSYSFEKSAYCAAYMDGLAGIKTFFPKIWFNKKEFITFEHIKTVVPQEYDKILTQLYGEYMKPPSPNERTSHNCAYLNLNKRLTYQQAIQEIKKK